MNVAASGGCGAHRVSEDALEPVDRRCLEKRLEPEFDGRQATAGHVGSMVGSSTKVEFYPDLGYILVVLGNTDSGNEAVATHVRSLHRGSLWRPGSVHNEAADPQVGGL